MSRSGWRWGLAALALAAACYANTLGNAFVWDDRLTAAPAGDAGASVTQRTGAYFRPLVMLSFRADRAVWGDRPAGFHLTNLLAHAGVGWLVGALAEALGHGPGVALAAALLFVAHPVQTEAVSYVSGRTDVLCTLFVLAALLVWRRARRALDAAAIAAAVLVVAAIACKETALLVPLVLLLPGANPSAAPPRPWIPVAAALAWTATWAATGGPGLQLAGLGGRLAAVAASAVTYLGLLVWPAPLHLERFVPVPGWSAGATIAMWAAILAVVGGLALVAARVRGGIVLLGLAAATYLPAAGLVPVYPAIAARALFAAEHFLYLPLAGLVPLVVAFVAARVPARAGMGITALLVAAWVPVVVARNRDWRDEETLFRETLRWNPPVARVWYDLANLRLAAGDPVEAERLYREAIVRAPRDGAVRLNLGIALQRQGRRDEAAAQYEEAVRLDPSLARAFAPPR